MRSTRITILHKENRQQGQTLGSDEEVAAINTLTERCIQVEPKSAYHA
jgi:hypothetical protein